MTTTTIRSCDFCGSKQLPTDKERWGTLVLGRYMSVPKGVSVTGTEPRDVCPVCIARLRQVAGVA